MEKHSYPNHTVRCIITGPSECGKSKFSTNMNLNIIIEYENINIYSTSLHQDLCQKLIKCFNNIKPTHKFPNILNEQEVDSVIE